MTNEQLWKQYLNSDNEVEQKNISKGLMHKTRLYVNKQCVMERTITPNGTDFKVVK